MLAEGRKHRERSLAWLWLLIFIVGAFGCSGEVDSQSEGGASHDADSSSLSEEVYRVPDGNYYVTFPSRYEFQYYYEERREVSYTRGFYYKNNCLCDFQLRVKETGYRTQDLEMYISYLLSDGDWGEEAPQSETLAPFDNPLGLSAYYLEIIGPEEEYLVFRVYYADAANYVYELSAQVRKDMGGMSYEYEKFFKSFTPLRQRPETPEELFDVQSDAISDGIIPLRMGNRWTYRIRSALHPTEFTWEVVGTFADERETIFVMDERHPAWSLYTYWINRPTGLFYHGSEREGVLNSPILSLQYPIRPGARWTDENSYDCTAMSEGEAVTTEAGDFICVMIGKSGSGATGQTGWYDPVVGLVRLESTYYRGRVETAELVAYQVW